MLSVPIEGYAAVYLPIAILSLFACVVEVFMQMRELFGELNSHSHNKHPSSKITTGWGSRLMA